MPLSCLYLHSESVYSWLVSLLPNICIALKYVHVCENIFVVFMPRHFLFVLKEKRAYNHENVSNFPVLRTEFEGGSVLFTSLTFPIITPFIMVSYQCRSHGSARHLWGILDTPGSLYILWFCVKCETLPFAFISPVELVLAKINPTLD